MIFKNQNLFLLKKYTYKIYIFGVIVKDITFSSHRS